MSEADNITTAHRVSATSWTAGRHTCMLHNIQQTGLRLPDKSIFLQAKG